MKYAALKEGNIVVLKHYNCNDFFVGELSKGKKEKTFLIDNERFKELKLREFDETKIDYCQEVVF